jgi:AraC-like DNA-binding protein
MFPLLSRKIVVRLLQTSQAPRITAALDGTGPSIVAATTALLTTRMDEPWSMSLLAATLRVSESTLFARFKEATGMTPAQYLKRTRLGEARRALIRALASDRPLLLLDEPPSHLDEVTEQRVMDAIDRFRRGRIGIVASHAEAVAAVQVACSGSDAPGSPAVVSEPRRAVVSLAASVAAWRMRGCATSYGVS